MSLFPIAVLAVGNAGWLGASMANLGLFPAGYPSDPDPGKIFVIVTHILAQPGVFGLIMAALLAALMSTADTLINATSAIVVNDIWRPYIVRGRDDQYYLSVARYASIAAAVAGVALVPLFMQFESIYVAHGAFVATVGPPMAVATLFGFAWKRYTPAAAFWTLLGGAIAMAFSIGVPDVITPLAHGVDPSGGFKYMRAFYGLVVSGIIGIAVTLFTKPRDPSTIVGLTMHSIREQAAIFKGGVPNRQIGKKVLCRIEPVPDELFGFDRDIFEDESKRLEVSVHPDDLAVLKAQPGDLIYIADSRWWYGGLRAAHVRVRDTDGARGVLRLPLSFIDHNSLLPEQPVRVELIM